MHWVALQGCEGGNNCVMWGSPYVHNSHYNAAMCFFGFKPSHAPCGQKPVDGNHRRLCPCTGLYDPCAGKKEGAACTFCDPAKKDCKETGGAGKTCQGGECKAPLHWVLDAKAEGDHSCDNVCKDEGGTCDQAEIDKLKTDDDVKKAFKEALGGYECKSVNKGCEGGNNCVKWGSPFIHSSHIGDSLCWSGTTNGQVAPCGQRPVDGHHRRLCPCL